MNQSSARFGEAVLEPLRSSFRGEIIDPAHPAYDRARVVWNARIDRRPALIARCTGVADVLVALKFARDQGALVAVRGGGHDVAGNAVCDGGVVIDLSPMKGVRVDPVKRTVRAQAGLTWAELDRETQAFGLATTGGQCSGTGIAGMTLGGGIGWLMRQHGLTIDNLISVDMVTADGRLVTASATENQELFWGLRGGGGNFGIVTELELRLHPVDQVVVAMIMHPGERFADALRFYQEFAATEPDACATALLYMPLAPMPQLPEHLHGKPGATIFACFNGSPADAEPTLQRLRAFGPPAAAVANPMPYLALQSLFNGSPGADYGYGQSIRSNYFNKLGDDAIEAMYARVIAAPSPMCAFEIAHLGGAVARVGEDETAFPRRTAEFFSIFQATWADPADAERSVRWTQESWEATRRFSSGATLTNYIDGDEPEARVRESFGEAKMERLTALKRAWDPTNFFRLNKNIKP